ncbi:MAG: OB-fold domain-containing protein, partial [Chloroflexi bacterium]|nr:OB-fold domain-containing protein [Chloroflexota bacterium]
RAPYIIAWIDLDEGFRMLSTIVGDEITIGQRVAVTWDDQENDISLPLFAPV